MSVPYCPEHAGCQVEAEAGLLGKGGCAGQVGGTTAVPPLADDFLHRRVVGVGPRAAVSGCSKSAFLFGCLVGVFRHVTINSCSGVISLT
jgi:hypothetical protein